MKTAKINSTDERTQLERAARLELNLYTRNAKLAATAMQLIVECKLARKDVGTVQLILENLIYHQAYTYISLSLSYTAYLDSKTNSKRMRGVLDALSANGYIHIVLGNQASGLTTRVQATPRLHLLLRPLMDLQIKMRERPCVVIKDEAKNDVDLHKVDGAHEHISLMKGLNAAAAKHKFEFEGKRLYVYYRRIFNNGSLAQGGRLYSQHQQLRSVVREKIKINDEPTIELDYVSIHAHLLYWRATGDIYRGSDAYTIPDVPRPLAKIAMQVLLNCTSRSAAQLALARHIREQHLPYRASDVLAAMESLHAPVRAHLYSGVGLELQRQDSDICVSVLQAFAAQELPILAVHDSFIVRAEDADRLRATMQAASLTHIGHVLPIK